MDDRTHSPLVPIGKFVQHQPLTWRKADPKTPVLPVDRPPVDFEAWAFWLLDMKRFDVRSWGRVQATNIVPLLTWDRNDRIIIDQVNHPAENKIDDRNNPLDGARVG